MTDKKVGGEIGSVTPSTKGIDELVQQAMTDDKFLAQLSSDPENALRTHGYPSNPAVVSRIKKIDFGALRDAFLINPAASLPYC